MKFYCSAVPNLRHEREYTVSQLPLCQGIDPGSKERENRPLCRTLKTIFFLSPSLEEKLFFLSLVPPPIRFPGRLFERVDQ